MNETDDPDALSVGKFPIKIWAGFRGIGACSREPHRLVKETSDSETEKNGSVRMNPGPISRYRGVTAACGKRD